MLLTALLYYFGWVRTHATLGYFGLDAGPLGYGTPDYLLRSISVTFVPFIGAALTTLVLLGAHRAVIRRACTADERTRSRIAATAATLWWVGLAAVGIVTAGLLIPAHIGHPLGITLPLLLIAGVAILGYTKQLRSLTQAGTGPNRAEALIHLALGSLGVLWAVGLYAGQVGERIADDITAGLATKPAVIVYSTDRIALAGSGVDVTEITQPNSRYRYRYTGIRLLVHTADRYLLLPMGWQQGHDSVFILQDSDTVRVDITAPPTP